MKWKLAFGERARLPAKIVKETVALFQFQKLVGDDTLESWAYQRPSCPAFRNTCDVKVDIVHRGVHVLELVNNLSFKSAE